MFSFSAHENRWKQSHCREEYRLTLLFARNNVIHADNLAKPLSQKINDGYPCHGFANFEKRRDEISFEELRLLPHKNFFFTKNGKILGNF